MRLRISAAAFSTFLICRVVVINSGNETIRQQILSPVSFLQGVVYRTEGDNDDSAGPVALCKAIVEIDNRIDKVDGRFACAELASASAAEYHRVFAEYPEQLPSQLLRVELSSGRSFLMYAVVNDTVANHLLRHGAFAPILTALVTRIASSCAAADGEQRLVVDLGCNLGLVSLAALAHGCAAVCVEPSPHLVPLLARSALRNRFHAAAAVVHAAAGEAWEPVRMTGCVFVAPADARSATDFRDGG